MSNVIPINSHTDSETRSVTLRFAARAEHLILSRLVLTGIAAAEGLSSQVVSDLKLAVTEACTNAIEHAYGDEPMDGADVEVCYTIDHGTLTVEVLDRGCGFDTAAALARRPTEATAKDGGMGLAIIGSLVDEMAITADAGGSRVRFSKHFDPYG